MPTFQTSQEWLDQSALLIKAYPTSTHITSKYSLQRPSKSRLNTHARRLARHGATDPTASSDAATVPAAPATIASFTLKTYSPDAGVCLKYTTDKAPEVGRLIAAAGTLGRHMAALPVAAETGKDVVMEDVGEGEKKEEVAGAGVGQGEKKDGKAGVGGGSGGKKKKKGKR